MLVELVGLAVPFLCVCRRFTFQGDVGPFGGIFRVDFQPLVETGLGIGLDRFRRAFRFAHTAVNALIRMDDQHVFTFVEAIDGADFHAVHVFAFNAIIGHQIGHFTLRMPLFLQRFPQRLWSVPNRSLRDGREPAGGQGLFRGRERISSQQSVATGLLHNHSGHRRHKPFPIIVQ